MTRNGAIMQNNEAVQIVRREAAAKYIGVSPTVLDRLTRKGCIPYIEFPSTGKVGRPVRKWALADLDAFIAEHRKVAGDTQAVQSVQMKRGKRRTTKSASGITMPGSAAAVLKKRGER